MEKQLVNTQVIRFEDCLKAGEVVWHAVPTKIVGSSIKKGEPAVVVETDCSKFGILSKFNGIVSYVDNMAIDEPCDIIIKIEEEEIQKKTKSVKINAGVLDNHQEHIANLFNEFLRDAPRPPNPVNIIAHDEERNLVWDIEDIPAVGAQGNGRRGRRVRPRE